MTFGFAPDEWRPWLIAIATPLIAAVVGLGVHTVLFLVLGRVAKRVGGPLHRSLVRLCRAPSRVIFSMLAVSVALPGIPDLPVYSETLRHLVSIGLVAGATWLAVRLTYVAEDAARRKFDISVPDNLLARRAMTRITVIRKVAVVVIIVVGAGVALMTIPRVRELGAGILASAGVAGLVVALAARPTAENLLAGLQIAMTQPINLDDVVVVEGEWGRIEEITATYVVVRIWDNRRLVLPITYFLQKPFQNWTRTTAEILGAVTIHVDYSAPVEEIRAELKRLLDMNEKWDKQGWALQVTEAHERTMLLRALMTAKDAPTAWDLRCEIREALIAYIRESHPYCLPRTRGEVEARLERGAVESGDGSETEPMG